jgi:hypothetical protein
MSDETKSCTIPYPVTYPPAADPWRIEPFPPYQPPPLPNIVTQGTGGFFQAIGRFIVPNKRVAVEPFPAEVKQTTVKNGVLAPMTESSLVKLKVVFGSDEYPEGYSIYVRRTVAQKTTYGQEVFEAEGKRFILLPEAEVVLVERYPELNIGEPAVTFTGTP